MRRTSPSAYNVFTAYTYTNQQQLANGLCSTPLTVITLSSAYTETLASASERVYLDMEGQRGFVDFVGFSTCTGGGENYVRTALVQVSDLTVSMTSTYSGVALAAMSTILAPSPTLGAFLRTTVTTNAFTTLTAATLEIASNTATSGSSDLVLRKSTMKSTSDLFGVPSYTATTFGEGLRGNGTLPFVSQAPSWGSRVSFWGSILLTLLIEVLWLL